MGRLVRIQDYRATRQHDHVMAHTSVTSSDGTTLGLARAGAGYPVLLIHGTTGAKEDWTEVQRRLADEFEVVTYDRRGRGESEDGPDYSIDREVDDVLAVIDACEGPVRLIGHSFGAVLALVVASRAGDRVERLVLYEPPIGEVGLESDQLNEDELDAVVAAGDLDCAVETFMQGVGATYEEIEANRGKPRVWAALRDGVRTAGREMRAAKRVLTTARELAVSVDVPTLVLMGAEQDNASYNRVVEFAGFLPSGKLAHVPGHHLAIVFAADDFVAVVRPFLRSEV